MITKKSEHNKLCLCHLFYAQSHRTNVCVTNIKLRLLPLKNTWQTTISIYVKDNSGEHKFTLANFSNINPQNYFLHKDRSIFGMVIWWNMLTQLIEWILHQGPIKVTEMVDFVRKIHYHNCDWFLWLCMPPRTHFFGRVSLQWNLKCCFSLVQHNNTSV